VYDRMSGIMTSKSSNALTTASVDDAARRLAKSPICGRFAVKNQSPAIAPIDADQPGAPSISVV